MSTVFTNNPIKINLYAINNTIKKTIVFIGSVPKPVKSELSRIETSGKYSINNQILNKFYGKNWDVLVGLKKHVVRGGGEQDFLFDFDHDVVVGDDNQQQNSKDIQNTHVNDEIKSDDDNTESNIPDMDIISLEELNDIKTPILDTGVGDKQKTLIYDNTKTSVKFIFTDPYISLYPEDNILEFKKKLYTVLNIPIFRQHIWYTYQGRVYPLNYHIYDDNLMLYINASTMLCEYNESKIQTQLVENIPINTDYYQKKDYLKVVAYDTFSILDEFYHKYGITEYNLMDLDDFISPSRSSLINIVSDQYQLELIYYSFIILYWPMLTITGFYDYIKNKNNIQKFYPDLHQPIQELTQMYALEKKIIDETIDLSTNIKKKNILKNVQNNITNSITESVISVLKYTDDTSIKLYIRNLFDKFQLNELVIGVKCLVEHNGKKIILNKTYKTEQPIKEKLIPGSIIFKIKISVDTIKTINLTMFKNGNYLIKGMWRDEKQYDFSDIFKICSNVSHTVIKTINSLGQYVMPNQYSIPFMTKHNSKFTEISTSIFYKKALTYEQFNILKKLMTDYRKAGIVNDKAMESSSMEYYFSKGMYRFDATRIERVVNINNYYKFLTDGVIKQKWNTIFEKTRITKIFHRFSDIKIEIIGVKEDEFFTFYNFITTLFHLFNEQVGVSTEKDIKSNTALTNKRSLEKTLRHLKEQDPVLYNFKKLYKTENVYSKICQKPYQPVMLNKQGYDGLPSDKKKNAVKYWNFTTKKDAYYSCPNAKYPYLKFIVNRHPKNLCIPCCKKTQVSNNTKDAKKIIYDACIKTHKYEKLERTITVGSRYIMSYGKDVEPGRISRLPENSLEPLLYETYSIQNQGIDQECAPNDGYYLYGIDQNINNIHNVGILNILINATETNLLDFINNIINLLKLSPNKFRVILNGEISKYFLRLSDFISTMNDLFMSDNTIKQYDNTIPWNDIFISIAYLLLNINFTYFQHSQNSGINLILPNHIKNKDQFLSSNFTNLLVIQKNSSVFPIYLLNTEVFFKVKMFKQKIFKFDDSVMIIISRLLSIYFNDVKKYTTSVINLFVIQAFVSDTSYTIKKIFVNKSNMCYYVHLINGKKNIFIPIELSHHITEKNVNITYEMFSRKTSKIDIHTLMHFTKDFNQWVAQKSEKAGMIKLDIDIKKPIKDRVQPIYPYMEIGSWLVLENITKKINKNSTVIGFVLNNIHYYTTNIKLSSALKIKKTTGVRVLYDPDIINKSIYAKEKIMTDFRGKCVGRSIYKSNLYQLLLLEFMHVFNNQRNTVLRKKLKQLLLKNYNKDFTLIVTVVSNIINYPADYTKIKQQIYDFLNNHHSRNVLFKKIDDTFYDFDREMFNDIKQLPRDKLINKLQSIAEKFVVYGDINKIKDFEFPNMFIACQNNPKKKYCVKNKLVIDKKVLQKLLKILTDDILNPIKEKWIFSSIFSDNTINYFKFIKRPDENITITVID
jgi:hypothetical protein